MKSKSNRVSIAVLVEGGIVQEVRSTVPFDLQVVDLDDVGDRAVFVQKAVAAAWDQITRTHRYN